MIGQFVPLRQISQDCAALWQHKAIFLLWVNHKSCTLPAQALICILNIKEHLYRLTAMATSEAHLGFSLGVASSAEGPSGMQ